MSRGDIFVIFKEIMNVSFVWNNQRFWQAIFIRPDKNNVAIWELDPNNETNV